VTPGADGDLDRIRANRFPIFSKRSGGIVLRWMRYWIERGHRRIGEPLDVETLAAFDALDEVLARPEHMLRFTMAPCEMLFVENARVAHDRSGFTDNPDSPRLMIRLWLNSRTTICARSSRTWSDDASASATMGERGTITASRQPRSGKPEQSGEDQKRGRATPSARSGSECRKRRDCHGSTPKLRKAPPRLAQVEERAALRGADTKAHRLSGSLERIGNSGCEH
jgi:TfdA family taurine catabolism dioxygenase TauD